jgi:hypothetical protein
MKASSRNVILSLRRISQPLTATPASALSRYDRQDSTHTCSLSGILTFSVMSFGGFVDPLDDLFDGLDGDPHESRQLPLSPIVDQLPPPPEDRFDWGTFAGDQSARPFLFHGTSALYHASLNQHGLDFRHVPYDPEEVARIVSLCKERGIETRGAARAALDAYTANTVRSRTVSLTFDWYRALRYAARCPGGETVDALRELLSACLEGHHAAAFTTTEIAALRAIHDNLCERLTHHQSLVVIVDFDIDWLDPETRPFFEDSAAHNASIEGTPILPPGALIRGFLGRGLRFPGTEVVTSHVPRYQIRGFQVVNLSSEQVEMLR